ncbi:alpha-xenorhabdolysin family binary toxin subunit B [Pseudomonas sp. BJa5]|uniref:alpha-xenorhabdolysin family binary toxin subunit B n=1 Tax=Pseudomonas sp. BJa5 TaxID=2936270 RepID=UPI0025599946|nr:alpha-xenorhabdolysin family binary toxin subunit B [Pseudomonas sp. BGr12]MDL2423646.1 alpha-xenorhabdolysin family binary toxin subunit B [Pseudomonas sp. BGr12]
MSNNVIALNTPLNVPDMNKILTAASTYSRFWEKRTFEFLPLLHVSVERHYQGFIKYVEALAKNAEVLAVGIKSENIELFLNDLREGMGAPDEEEFLLEEIQRSANNIGKKLDVLLAGVQSATKSIASLPVYQVDRDRSGYLEAQERLASRLQALHHARRSKEDELSALENAIDVLEANGIEKLHAGKLPTVAQLQALVAQGATSAGAAIAIEQALEALSKLLGGLQDGMRYSQLQDQRRTLQTQVGELRAEQREQEQRAQQINSYLESLSAYAPLIEKRVEWLAEKHQIYVQLQAERNKLRNIKLNGTECVQALQQLLMALLTYVKHIVDKYRATL